MSEEKDLDRTQYHNMVMEKGQKYIQGLIDAGLTVQKLTDYQYRINSRLDIYPRNKRYHDIKTNKRGSYVGVPLDGFVMGYFIGLKLETDHE